MTETSRDERTAGEHSQLCGRSSRRSPGGPAAETGPAADPWSRGSVSRPERAAGRREVRRWRKGGEKEKEES